MSVSNKPAPAVFYFYQSSASLLAWQMWGSPSGHVQILLLLLLSMAPTVFPVLCNIGYGQRGYRYQNEIMWQRNCIETTYCFEAVTGDVEKMKPLIDYPWDPYYREFYIKSCGGFNGMPNVFHPWQDIEGANEDVVGSVKVNLTFAPTITTIGGTQQFDLRYTCRKDLCSGGHAAARGLGVLGLFSLALATALISSSN